MAYYTALQTAWNSVTQPPVGVTGTGLSTGQTTLQKLANVNAWTVAGTAIPMVVPTYTIYNLIVPSEFVALTAANQQLVRDILSMGTVDGSPGTSVRTRMVTIFTSGTTTFSNLSNLAKTYDTPAVNWTSANGYPKLELTDTAAAGLT